MEKKEREKKLLIVRWKDSSHLKQIILGDRNRFTKNKKKKEGVLYKKNEEKKYLFRKKKINK